MSLYEKWAAAGENRDAEAMIACLHPDYTFVRHQTGTTMNRDEVAAMFRTFMSSTDVVVHSQRCVYENDDVLVEHSVMDFADGTREAVLSFNEKKDGLIYRCETGATPLSR